MPSNPPTERAVRILIADDHQLFAESLMTAIGEPGVSLAPGGELTRNVLPAGNGDVDVLVVTDAGGSVAITPNTAAGAKAFRCVTDPLN